ncbi:CDP-glucose 4,6-dehydratase [Baekduia sp. Peel2402]|uniref:CDP-glucose 4,6-dehydratase n=1 Tax=Baekduia sp. Peel2402 TaxID=3458296 RepID=UPI00403EDBB2
MSALPDPAFWSGRRVLVTGDTGFKGAWLSLWLTELGATVIGLSDGVPTEPSLWAAASVGDVVEHHDGDVRDAKRVVEVVRAARAEVVLHLAAQPMVRRSYAEPVETYATNVMGTVHVLDAIRRVGGDHVAVAVVVTSDKCYENREWPWGYREDEPLGGHDPYSSSKGAAELVTAAYRSSFFSGDGAPAIASARAGNVIGGGDWGEDRLVPDIYRAVAAGQPVRIRNPHAIRPWQHVLNPLSGYLRLAERAAADPTLARAYNFGPAEDDVRPVGWIVERLAVHSETDDGPHPHEAHWLKLDSSLARTALGWRPAWDLTEGLRHTADWYRAHREGEDVAALTRAQIAAFGR